MGGGLGPYLSHLVVVGVTGIRLLVAIDHAGGTPHTLASGTACTGHMRGEWGLGGGGH